jgi:predicted ATPase/class 3 adenylate cyclase
LLRAIVRVMVAQPTGTVTLLFTDIEGSTRLLERLGRERYAEALDLHRRLLRASFERHYGYEVDCEGDAFFVAFSRAEHAVAAAAQVQRALADAQWPGEHELRVRMGIHTGEPLSLPPKYVGLDVHKAARIMAAGHGGQVLLSQSTRDLLDPRVRVAELGEHRLKDLSGSQNIYQLLVDGLPSEFPMLKTIGGRPTNLPAPPNALIGRTKELREVAELLRRNDVRLVTLIGPGGTGKTRLALQIAADLIDEFGQGVFFVSLAPIRDINVVVPTIAQALGLREQAGEPLIKTLSEYLREKQILLLLDNFEQIAKAAPSVAFLLAVGAKVKALVTSRTPLRLSGERAYEVPPLSLPDPRHLPGIEALTQYESVALFLERAVAAKAAFGATNEDASAIAEICIRLDGLPLALELAAARIRVLSPQALLARLDQRLRLLTGGAQDLDERQHTLRATIGWSYGLLSGEEKTLFAQLGVFAGGCQIDSAEAVCDPRGEMELDVLDGLIALVENSLLRQRNDPDGESRFWMLETIREYALESLRPTIVIEELRDRHAEHFLAFAELAALESRTADQSEWFERLDADAANLRAAIEWTRAAGQPELTVRFAAALWSYWCARGYLTEGRRRLEEVLTLTHEPPAQALLGLCTVRHLGGGVSHREVLADAKHVLAACERLRDDFLLAQSWNLIGRLQGSGLGDHKNAEDAYKQALVFAERGNYPAEKAESMGWLMVSANFGPLPVEEGIARCQAFLEQAGEDLKVRAFCLVSRAPLEAMRGESDLARRLLGEGTRAFKALGLNVWAANNAQEGFYVEMLAGNPGGAATMLRNSYDSLEAMGEHGFLSTIAGFLAQSLYELEQYEEAERFGRRCEEFATEDDVLSQVLWRCARAKVTARRGEPARAEELAREAVELIEQTEMLNSHADAVIDLAEVLALDGRWAEAHACSSEAGRLYARKGNVVSLLRALQRTDALAARRGG